MREESPTALNIRSYQLPIWEFCGVKTGAGGWRTTFGQQLPGQGR